MLRGVLDGLDEIAWDAEEDLLGPATEIPGLLREMAVGDATGQRRALNHLQTRLVSPDGVAPVGVRCVPFLRRLLAQEAIRTDLLLFLADLATGGDHEVFLRLRPCVTEAALADPVLHVAVADGLVEYRGHLTDKRPETRAAAGLLVAFASREVDDLVLLFQAASAEPVAGARASLVISLGLLAIRTHRPLPPMERFQSDDSPLVVLGAAMALRYNGEPLDPVAAETLSDMVELRRRVPSSFAIGRSSLFRMGVAHLADDAVRYNIPKLLENLVDLGWGEEREEIAQMVLAATFQHAAGNRPRLPSELTSTQRRLLKFLDDAELRVWTRDPVFFGVPTITGLRRYLGSAGKNSRALDRRVFEAPMWHHTQEALHGRMRMDRWVQLVTGAFESHMVVDLVADAFSPDQPYVLYPWPSHDAGDPSRCAMHLARFWGETLASCAWSFDVRARLEALVDDSDSDPVEILAHLLAVVAWKGENAQLDSDYERLALPVVNDPRLEDGARTVLESFYKPRRRRVLRAASATARARFADYLPKTNAPAPPKDSLDSVERRPEPAASSSSTAGIDTLERHDSDALALAELEGTVSSGAPTEVPLAQAASVEAASAEGAPTDVLAPVEAVFVAAVTR